MFAARKHSVIMSELYVYVRREGCHSGHIGNQAAAALVQQNKMSKRQSSLWHF